MTYAPKEIIAGASVPLTNGSSVTFSVAGHAGESPYRHDPAARLNLPLSWQGLRVKVVRIDPLPSAVEER